MIEHSPIIFGSEKKKKKPTQPGDLFVSLFLELILFVALKKRILSKCYTFGLVLSDLVAFCLTVCVFWNVQLFAEGYI